MKETILAALKGLLGSKKFQGVIIGSLTSVFSAVALFLLAKLGVEDEEIKAKALEMAGQLPLAILALFGVGVGSQGLADHGKEKAKVEADSLGKAA